MGFITDKLFKKKRLVEYKPAEHTQLLQEKLEGTQYLKEDIIVFVMTMDKIEQREHKDYCLLGYLNKNKTKFKDVATGKVYEVENGEDKDKIIIKGSENTPEYAPIKETPVDYFYFISSSGKYKLLELSDEEMTLNPLLTGLYNNYICKRDGEIIYESQILSIKENINDYFDRKVQADLLEQSKKQEIENKRLAEQQRIKAEQDKIKEGYSQDF